ncbi:MAG: rod shape-determining protein MreC [Anaerolineaceae bacterium]|nr:rod shape-determining protein MreC [Anaerolineaceae bacterium]
MRRWRANPWVFLVICLVVSIALVTASQLGILGPFEGIVAAPLNFVSGLVNRMTLSVSRGIDDLTELETLRQRNADLEESLAQLQSEVVELREIQSDYNRLAELLDYTTSVQNQESLAADVILQADVNSLLRTIVINKGARDGIAVGMPVVTRQGLIGRITDVTADSARVLLITDPSSAVSGRLQSSRAEGSVVGRAGGLTMIFIPLGAAIEQGDLVLTSGLGGNLPPDIVIGVVTSVQKFEFELYQQAQIQSLADFNTLEIVLVITNFQPADLSAFETDANGGNGQ